MEQSDQIHSGHSQAARTLPAVSDVVFFGTCIAGVLLTVALTADLGWWPAGSVRSVATFAEWLDPSLLLIASWMVVLHIVAVSHTPASRRRPSLQVYVACAVGVGGLLAVQVIAEWLWLHRAFLDVGAANVDPWRLEVAPIGEGWLTRLGVSLLGTGTGDRVPDGPSPNGMVWRQMWLALLAMAYCGPFVRAHGQTKEDGDRAVRRLAWRLGALAGLWVYVGLNRILLGRSTWFDLGITAGVSVYTFWVLYALVSRLLSSGERARFLDVSGMSLVFLPVLFYLSGSKVYWVIGGVAIVSLLGLVDFAAGIVEGVRGSAARGRHG